MSLLDRAIGFVAPRVALQRARSRASLELTTGYLERHAQRVRYDDATAGRRAHGWHAASTDANVGLMGSLIWLRERSRDISIPSRTIANALARNSTEHAPVSSRLCQSTKPSRSQTKIFSRSARRDRNTNKCPRIGQRSPSYQS
jgi:hypothetical protein